jgi:hypothetical protein
LLTHQPLPMGHGAPQPWPALPAGSEILSVSTP